MIKNGEKVFAWQVEPLPSLHVHEGISSCCNQSTLFSCCLTLSLLQILQWSRLRHAHSVLESFHLLLYDLSSEVLLNEVCHVDKMEQCLCMTYTVTVAGNSGKDTFACSLEDSHLQ